MPSMPERRRQDRELRKLIADGVFATEDKQGQINILRQWQREGNVPAHFDTPNQLIDQVAAVIASGKPKAEALQELQVFLPRTFFDKSGNINKRVVRNTPGKSLSDAWDQVNNGLSAAQLDKIQKADWKDLQEQYREVGRRLGFKLDIGHFKTSAAGAPQDVSAGSAEYNLANQAAGRTENAYRPMSSAEMGNVGASSNKVEGMSEAALRAMGLPTRGGSVGSPLNPYISVLLGTEHKGISSRLLPSNNLEQLNRFFEDQVKQGSNPVAMYDYIRERGGDKLNYRDMARAGLEQYDLSRFHPSQVAEPPVRVTKAPEGSALSLNAGLGTDAYEVLKDNWRGAAMGAGLNLANPDTVKDIASGNLGSAAQRAAQDTAIGVAGEQVAGLAAQGLAKVAPQAAAQILPRAANLAAAATPAGLTLLAAQGIQAVNDARVEAKARGLGMTAEQLRQKWRKEDTGAARQALGAASRGYRAGKRNSPAAAAPLITVNGKPLDIANELEYAGKQVLKIFGIGK